MASPLNRPGFPKTRPRNHRSPPHNRTRLAEDTGYAMADAALLDEVRKEVGTMGRDRCAGAVVLE